MRKMTISEIVHGLEMSNWATICTVTPHNTPYAVEATYFYTGDEMGFMINPNGTTARNLSGNPDVQLKVTLADPTLEQWAGISCFGSAFFETDTTAIRDGWKRLGIVMNADYGRVAEKFCRQGRPSPFLRVPIDRMTGRCSAAARETFQFASLGTTVI